MSSANLRAIQAIKEKDEAEKREELRRAQATSQPSTSSTLVQQQRALVAQVQALNTKKRQLEEAEKESAKRVSSRGNFLVLCETKFMNFLVSSVSKRRLTPS